ncbi:unnamed protein product [Boreogadus saida]
MNLQATAGGHKGLIASIDSGVGDEKHVPDLSPLSLGVFAALLNHVSCTITAWRKLLLLPPPAHIGFKAQIHGRHTPAVNPWFPPVVEDDNIIQPKLIPCGSSCHIKALLKMSYVPDNRAVSPDSGKWSERSIRGNSPRSQGEAGKWQLSGAGPKSPSSPSRVAQHFQGN